MKQIRVEDAVGMVLGYDLTKIVPGEFKGAAFKKGHIIRVEDIEELKKIGKNNINVIDLKDNLLHEDEAALRLGQAAAGEGIYLEGPSEGKINLTAVKRGLVKINLQALQEVNEIDSIILSTLHNNTLVEKHDIIAGTKIIPLTIEKNKVEQVENICKKLGRVVTIKEIMPLKVGIVVTGTEVYEGRITDKFGPVLEEKLIKYGGELLGTRYAPDVKESIQQCIKFFINKGAEVILVSGGMSVDADDVTPTAIREISNRVVTYGSPVLPGAMFMLAYGCDREELHTKVGIQSIKETVEDYSCRNECPTNTIIDEESNEVTIIGVPACGMYNKTTVFDLIFPRVLTREILTKKDIKSLAHGGLCLKCDICKYPICPFGKESL